MPTGWLEQPAFALQVQRSTTELSASKSQNLETEKSDRTYGDFIDKDSLICLYKQFVINDSSIYF